MREYVRDRERLEHMVEAIDRILDFAKGKLFAANIQKLPGITSPRCATCWCTIIFR